MSRQLSRLSIPDAAAAEAGGEAPDSSEAAVGQEELPSAASPNFLPVGAALPVFAWCGCRAVEACGCCVHCCALAHHLPTPHHAPPPPARCAPPCCRRPATLPSLSPSPKQTAEPSPELFERLAGAEDSSYADAEEAPPGFYPRSKSVSPVQRKIQQLEVRRCWLLCIVGGCWLCAEGGRVPSGWPGGCSGKGRRMLPAAVCLARGMWLAGSAWRCWPQTRCCRRRCVRAGGGVGRHSV